MDGVISHGDEIERMHLKTRHRGEHESAGKNKIVWCAGNWLAVTTGVETPNEMSRQATAPTPLLCDFLAP